MYVYVYGCVRLYICVFVPWMMATPTLTVVESHRAVDRQIDDFQPRHCFEEGIVSDSNDVLGGMDADFAVVTHATDEPMTAKETTH